MVAALDVGPGYEQDLIKLQTIVAPADRLEDTTPTIHKPAAVLGTVGLQITGTIIGVQTDVTPNTITLDVRNGKIYLHQLRNVLTYSGAIEDTWTLINYGMAVYYDRSSTMPAAVKLSTSPLDKDGVANALFGHIVWAQTEEPDPFQGDRDPYPAGNAGAGVTHLNIAILQYGMSGNIA